MGTRSSVVLLLLVCGACDGGPVLPGEPLDDTPVSDPAVATIGAAGGTLTSTDGRLTLVFPAGALASETEIAITEIALPGGRGWILEPDSLALAMPVAATITLSEDEAGAPTTEVVDGDDVVTLPMLHVIHAPLRDAAFEDVDVTAAWREPDAELDYAFELAHFSLVAYLEAGGQELGRRASIPLDTPFRVHARQTSAPAPVSLLFRCGDELRRVTFDVAFLPGEATLESLDRIQLTGTRGWTFDNTGYYVEGRCTSVGLDNITMVTPIEPITSESRRPQVEGCRLDESVVTVRRELTVDCTDRFCVASDPVDMPMPDGDPSLDLTCVTTGTSPAGQAWVRVVFAGPWRPSADYYSWFSRVRFDGAAGSIGFHLVEHHDGVDTEMEGGGLPPTVYHEEASGYLLVLPPALTGMVTAITVDSGVQKTVDGTFVPDGIATFTFDATEREY